MKVEFVMRCSLLISACVIAVGLPGCQDSDSEGGTEMQKVEAYGVVTPWTHGKAFDLSVAHRALESNPRWSDTRLSPPVRVEEAVELATKELSELVSTPVHVRSAKLQRLEVSDNWIWLIEFGAGDGGTSQRATVQVAILMDGRAIAPRLADDDRSFAIE